MFILNNKKSYLWKQFWNTSSSGKYDDESYPKYNGVIMCYTCIAEQQPANLGL